MSSSPIDPSAWTSAIISAAALVAAIATILGVRTVAVRIWRVTGGARRYQQGLVDQLACGESMAYVTQVLGSPVFSGLTTGGEELLYRLRGCWVWLLTYNGSVAAFGVTVMNRRLHVTTRNMTAGQIDVKVVRSTFRQAPETQDARLVLGARRAFYEQLHYFGNPGNYLSYVLSYSDLGVTSEFPAGGPGYGTGRLSAFALPAGSPAGEIPRGLTINTIAVLGRDCHVEQLFQDRSLCPVGADQDVVRTFNGRR